MNKDENKSSSTYSIIDAVDRSVQEFDKVATPPTIIKVVGVGGGGNNAINHMYNQEIGGVSFVVLNTDRQALLHSPVPNRVLIGPNTTYGLGAGNDPELAKRAAEESADDISKLFDDGTRMVFITAGMGGGTGTGAAPVVARIAREKGVLTIGIVTIPFLFEGRKKITKALNGADEMKKYVDALLVINNERLTEIYADLNFINAFGKADDTLSIAASSISDIINVTGKINLDFNDVNTTLRNGGVAIISTGYGEGEERVRKAIDDALESPLLKNRDIYGAKKILVNIYFSPKAKNEFKTSELDEMHKFMTNFSKDIDVIWGTAYDEKLEERVKVTILASGFNVSIDSEAGIEVRSAAEASPGEADRRIEQEYGREKIAKTDLEKAAARYLVLRLEDMDNDDIIEMLEKYPTFTRDNKFRNEIRELQTMQKPKLKPSPSAEKPTKGKKRGGFGAISFE